MHIEMHALPESSASTPTIVTPLTPVARHDGLRLPHPHRNRRRRRCHGPLRRCSLLWLYLQSRACDRYLRGSPYVLDTGASDGIGRAVATELYAKGFNLVIDGRDEAKLRKVQAELLRSARARNVRVLVADASAPEPDFEAAVAQWADIRISLVVDNVGGSPVYTTKSVVSLLAVLPFRLTRVLPSPTRLRRPRLVDLHRLLHRRPLRPASHPVRREQGVRSAAERVPRPGRALPPTHGKL